jgi:hypothetical protein
VGAATVKGSDAFRVWPETGSTATIATAKVPAAGEAPLNAPPAEIEIPAGKPAADHATEPDPPVAARITGPYARFTFPFGRNSVVMNNAP